MGNCTVCDGTASKKEEFVTHGSMLGFGSQISNRLKGSTKDDQQLAPDEEQKNVVQASYDHLPANHSRTLSLRFSIRDQPAPEDSTNWPYRKDFPVFAFNDMVGCISNDYTNDYEAETILYTGQLPHLSA